MIPQMARDRDWSPYNSAQQGRSPRSLAERALGLAGLGRGRRAVELGSGAGIEARLLADAGWHVVTVDPDPSVVQFMDAMATTHSIEHVAARVEDLSELPSCSLMLSSTALPYVPRERFADVWRMIREALSPHAVLAVDLFGVRDAWASTQGTFLDRSEVDELFVGLETLAVDECEYDGPAFSGPKHWHTFEVIARRPTTV